jgi:hypothetical protein
LDGESGNQDYKEHPIVEEMGENIKFAFTELTRVDLVEQLHEDEGLEDN